MNTNPQKTKIILNGILILSFFILMTVIIVDHAETSPTPSFYIVISLVTLAFLAGLIIINYFYSQKLLLSQKKTLLENQLKIIIESVPELVCAFDTQARLMFSNSRCNLTFHKIFGRPISVGMKLEELVEDLDPNTKQEILQNWARVFSGEELLKIREISGDSFEVSSNRIKNEENKTVGTIHLLRNITYRMKQEKKMEFLNHQLINEMRELDQRNQKMASLVEFGDTLLACSTLEEVASATYLYGEKILDFANGILYIINEQDILELKGSWGSIHTNMLQPIELDKCWAIKQSRRFHVKNPELDLVCEHLKHNPNYLSPYMCIPLIISNKILGLIYLELKTKIISDQHKHLISGVTEAIALALSNVKLRYQLLDQSFHDSLTGLYNRRYLEEFLTKMIHQAKRENKFISLIMFDIDNFKIFNDRYGHEAGDIVMREISHTFQNIIRAGDVACRYGGEEFIWLMPNCTLEFAKRRAEELRIKIAKTPIIYGTQQLEPVTISFGIALFPQDGSTANQIIDSADRALYSAKNTGRNKIVTYSEFISENDART